jgi:hypothetical protein
MSKGGKRAKTEWTQPRLIILARTNPEEAVLTGCKYTVTNSSTGPQTQQARCQTYREGQCDSPNCSANVTS